MFLYIRVAKEADSHYDSFRFYKKIKLTDIKEFKQISMDFYFKLQDDPESFEPVDTMIFAKIDKIFEFNFETEEFRTRCDFNQPF